MRLVLLFISLAVSTSLFAQIEKDPLKRNPEFKRFVYETNQQIKLRYYDSLYFDIDYEQGNNWVFKFDYSAPESPAIADDEFSEQVLLEMPAPRGNRFTINQSDLKNLKVIYGRSCFCKDSGPRLVKDATITGKKVGRNRWLLSLKLWLNQGQV
ncbi:MAG: hypothetical protein FGM41_07425 [Bacteroidetes bacterium]|nr:hypothetical protein [Bacteroidota bacterium]